MGQPPGQAGACLCWCLQARLVDVCVNTVFLYVCCGVSAAQNQAESNKEPSSSLIVALPLATAAARLRPAARYFRCQKLLLQQNTSMETKTSENHLEVQKMKKKVLRKQVRAQHTLMRHEGIKCVSHATQSLVIANAGLGNGMSRQQLLRILEEYGAMETLLMPPNKPYSFVKYRTTEEAKKAFNTLNGKEVTLEDCGQNIILYINFVEKG
ncbi:hypothetical protein DV515_00003330, partial [Chloebia gouldiae]